MNLLMNSGIVEPWEAILTLSFFFAVVVTAYMADRKIFCRGLVRQRKSARPRLKSISIINNNPAFVADEPNVDDRRRVGTRSTLADETVLSDARTVATTSASPEIKKSLSDAPPMSLAVLPKIVIQTEDANFEEEEFDYSTDFQQPPPFNHSVSVDANYDRSKSPSLSPPGSPDLKYLSVPYNLNMLSPRTSLRSIRSSDSLSRRKYRSVLNEALSFTVVLHQTITHETSNSDGKSSNKVRNDFNDVSSYCRGGSSSGNAFDYRLTPLRELGFFLLSS